MTFSFVFSGDLRVNEQHNLLAMHTVWMREHNRVAKELKSQHSNWNDQKLYQEARRIVIGEYQHVLYNEWLPLIIGHDAMNTEELWPLSSGLCPKIYVLGTLRLNIKKITFKNWKPKIYNMISNKIKCLKSDNFKKDMKSTLLEIDK